MTSNLEIIKKPKHDHDHDQEHGLVDLPECLQRHILSNLPYKTMFIFRCVSKRWNSFITESYIVKKQLNSSLSTTLPWTLLVGRIESLNETDLTPIDQLFVSAEFSHDRLAFSIINSNFQRPDLCYYGKVEAVSSSNGLILCHSGKGYDIMYAICNPITLKWILVPYKKFKNSIRTEAFVTKVDEFTSKVVGYKVIRVHYNNCFTKQFGMEIYDSDVKKWTESTLTLSDGFHVNSRRAVCLNGIVHWEGRYENWSPCIVAYDPYSCIENQYRLFKLPNDNSFIPGNPTAYTLFEVCNGKLQFAKVFMKCDSMAIWVLENYDEGVFELKHKILFDEISNYRTTITNSCDIFKPLAFHPFDSNIIYICTNRQSQVLSYNIKTGTLSNLHLTMPTQFSFELFPYVLPLWPPAVDRSLTL